MKIIKAKVQWNWYYSNPPSMQILVDEWSGCWNHEHEHYGKVEKIFDNPNVIWETKALADQTFVWHEEDGGLLNFFHHVPGNQSGYGGRTFSVYTKDGLKHFKGSWSSNPEQAEEYIGKPSFDVSITCDPEGFDRGYTFSAAHITIDAYREACKLAGIELMEVETPYWDSKFGSDLSSDQMRAVNAGIPPNGYKISYTIKAIGKKLKDPKKHPKTYMDTDSYLKEKWKIAAQIRRDNKLRKKYANQGKL